MIPRLYKKDDDFTKNGYGFFGGCSRCDCTEEENGEYFCEISLKPNDRLIDVVSPGMYIKALANNKDRPQLFEVKNIEIDRYGRAEITANHVKDHFFSRFTSGGVAVGGTDGETGEPIYSYTGTASQVVSEIMQCVGSYSPYTISVTGFGDTTKTLEQGFELPTQLGDVFTTENGIIDLFGGSFHYNNFDVYYEKNRGSSISKNLRYGSYISDYTQTLSNSEMHTHVYAYAKVSVEYNDTATPLLYGTEIATGADLPQKKVFALDVTDKLKKTTYKRDEFTPEVISKITAKIGKYGQQYVNSNRTKLTQPSVTIRVTYRSELDKFQDVGLCDTVAVSYGPQKIANNVRVTKAVFDSLQERYKELQFGDKKLTLSSFIKKSGRR